MLVSKFCKTIYGVSLAALGIHQFILDYFIASIPGPDSWIAVSFHLIGFVYKISFITLSLTIIVNYKPRVTSVALGILMLVWIMFRHLPLVIFNITDPAEINYICFAFAICGGAFLVAGSTHDNVSEHKNYFMLFGLPSIHSIGKFFFGLPMLVFGLQHLLYAEFISSVIPNWIPGGFFWAYATGAALICAGISILSNIKIKWSTLWLGVMITLWVLMVHLPGVIMNPKDGYEWTSLFQSVAISASAFLLRKNLSGELPVNQSPKHKNREPNRDNVKHRIHLSPRKPQIKTLNP